ncbi:MAG: polymerase sigma-70 factor, subfamily [Mycobacterium sp.]|nr:polymerase sigma-70 factor, subfamily [Mycobacterium sp.]
MRWLIGVARHKLADHLRRRPDRLAVSVADVPEPADPTDGWDAELDRIVAESTLRRLSEPHRAVLTLRYMDDCSVPECADLIGRTVHATEALLVRARRSFRDHYEDPGARRHNMMPSTHWRCFAWTTFRYNSIRPSQLRCGPGSNPPCPYPQEPKELR